jgi:hypothetical protein
MQMGTFHGCHIFLITPSNPSCTQNKIVQLRRQPLEHKHVFNRSHLCLVLRQSDVSYRTHSALVGWVLHNRYFQLVLQNRCRKRDSDSKIGTCLLSMVDFLTMTAFSVQLESQLRGTYRWKSTSVPPQINDKTSHATHLVKHRKSGSWKQSATYAALPARPRQ